MQPKTRRDIVKYLMLAGAFVAGSGSRRIARAAGAPGGKPGGQRFKPRRFSGSRTIRLSPAARSAPLPANSWLKTYRDILTRAGGWATLPTGTEATAIIGSQVRVVDLLEPPPVDELLGIGSLVLPGTDSFHCDSNSCGEQGVSGCETRGKTDGRCEKHDCTYNDCEGLSGCGEDSCWSQKCPKNQCDKHYAIAATSVSDLQAQWAHPFVVELRAQFDVRTADALSIAVRDFMARNGYVIR